MASIATFCDGLRTCWLTHFDTHEEYQSCIAEANATQSVCNGTCEGGDSSEADATKTTCDDTCNSTNDDCLDTCQGVFDSCVAICDPPGPDTPCFIACFAARVSCQNDCHDALKACRSTCYLNWQIALAGVLPEDAICLAGCCSSHDDHLTVCKGPCQNDYDTDFSAANVTYWTCVSGCELVGWDEGDGFFYDADCTDACTVTQQIAIAEAQNNKALCDFDCQADFDNQWNDCGTNYRCTRKCNKDRQDALLLCLAAQLGGADDSTYAHCANDAANDYNRCTLECCFNLKGRNLYDVAAMECLVNKADCITDLIDDCPAPGTGSGDPCEIADSPECLAATAAHESCVNTHTTACNDNFKTCIQAIEAKSLANCGGCLGEFTFPDV